MSKEECVAKGCTSATCEYMKGSSMMEQVSKKVTIEKTNVNGAVVATITTDINGKVETQVFEGTDAEVQSKIDALK
jgi:K(+)-stimulated pyrophosphate-energized sodium pump